MKVRRVIAVLAGVLGVAVLSLCVVAWLAVDFHPALVRDTALNPVDVERAKNMLRRADPRKAPVGKDSVATLSVREMDLLLNDALRRLTQGSAKLSSEEGRLNLVASVPLARWGRVFQGLWINTEMTVVAPPGETGRPRLDRVRLGSVPVPEPWMRRVLIELAHRHGVEGDAQDALNTIRKVDVSRGRVQITYRWDPSLGDRLKSGWVAAGVQEAMGAYVVRLDEVLKAAPRKGGGVAMLDLLVPLAETAHQRTAAQAILAERQAGSGSDLRTRAATENRALLLTLALYASHRPFARVVPAAREWPQPAMEVVTLGGRDDHPQHWLISAVLAAEGGGRLADVIGVYKEMNDTGSGGSGFSFDDLAADRAGTRMGQRAVRDPVGFQQALRSVKGEGDVMPSIAGLPSFLSAAEFKRDFGSVGSSRYNAVLRDVELRVEALPILH